MLRSLTLALLAALPLSQRVAFKPRPLSPFERQKAEQLLRNRYPCLGCHQLGGKGGHIGPALDGLRARRSRIGSPSGKLTGSLPKYQRTPLMSQPKPAPSARAARAD